MRNKEIKDYINVSVVVDIECGDTRNYRCYMSWKEVTIMINNIHMRSCATYNERGASLMSCKRVNFIYGANGSGKSTISNFLLQQDKPCFSSSSIDWYGSTHEEIKVYLSLIHI